MHFKLNNTTTDYSPLTKDNPKRTEDYSEILKNHSLKFKTIPPYLQVGEITQVQGWLLHLSVVACQLETFLKMLIPILIIKKVPFKIVSDKETACNLLDGLLSYTQLGKVVCIYSNNEIQAVDLAKELIELTQSFKGPAIPTDAYLGGAVYTRYGSFHAVMKPGMNGQSEKFIYDQTGNLVIDSYTIPFALPNGVIWPFTEIINLAVPKSKKILNKSYRPIAVIKADAKGKVLKGLYLKGFLNVKSCIIKQGKRNMAMDDAGRSIEDRLVWQKELYDNLANEIPLPKIVDLFQEDGDSYLVMDYLKGDLLYNVVNILHQGRTWFDLSNSKKSLLLDYLIEIVTIIERLHRKGFVHRDITPFNFLITKNKYFYLIDLELTYSFVSKKPDPPFKKGTFGFMSPEQFAVETPTVKEDVYGLGALMIFFFTGLLPGKFDTNNTENLLENLYFFFPVKPLVDTITACIDPNPEARPELQDIKTVLRGSQKDIASLDDSNTFSSRAEIDVQKSKVLINNSLNSLSVAPMISAEQLWSSKKRQQENLIGNEQMGCTYYSGLHDGISGVLYLLSKAKKSGLITEECINIYYKNWEYLESKYLTGSSQLLPGLYRGTTGIALTIAGGIESGLIERNEKYILKIQECLEQMPSELNLASGITGQAIAILNCASCLDKNLTQSLLQKCTSKLLENQEKDGSWRMTFSGNKKGIPILNFASGIAGISWLLLEYSSRYLDLRTENSAVRALDYLIAHAHKKRIGFIKQSGAKSKIENPWMDNDFTGIALTFIKAYEILQKPFYKEIAEAALYNLPRHFISPEFSQSHGLAGIGEVYLEAHRVFKTPEWLYRAIWIANLFFHTRQKQSDNSVYWLIDTTSSFPTADLLVGNSGIIHFLMRSVMPDKIGYPLLYSS